MVATVAQMLVAGALVYAETSSYWSIMTELDRRVKEVKSYQILTNLIKILSKSYQTHIEFLSQYYQNLIKILSGSESFKLGETGGEGRGGAVPSFVNGVGNCGSIVEGPLIGLLLTLTGWEGVLGSFVGVNTVGALILYQGYTTSIKPGLLPS